MSIIINELSIKTTGNVVKTNDSAGNSILRMTEAQAAEIFADLREHFAGQDVNGKAGTVEIPANLVAPTPRPISDKSKGVSQLEAHDNGA